MRGSGRTILFLVYVLFALYFANAALGFIALPDGFLKADKWLTLVGGILILLGGINYLRAHKKYI